MTDMHRRSSVFDRPANNTFNIGLDIEVSVTIENVPDKVTADKLTADIRQMLTEKYGSEIVVTWEDVSNYDTGDQQ